MAVYNKAKSRMGGSVMLANYEHRAFDKGSHLWIEKYSGLRNIPHWHFESELIACLAGRATVMLEGQYYELTPEYCVFCNSESIHNIVSDRDSLLLVAQLEKPAGHELPEYRFKAPLFRDRYLVKERMQRIYREYQTKPRFYAEMVNAVATELMVDILRGEELTEKRGDDSFSVLRYKELLSEIGRHYNTLSFKDAAAFMNMSEAYFSRFFKRVSGMTFSRYLNVVRVSRAIDLLGSSPDLSVGDLLAETGFNTIRNFNRVFKSVTGYAPRQLPANYILHIRSLTTEVSFFDPTLDTSEAMSGETT